MNEIIININEANKAQKYQNENELFQIEAFKKVAEILKEHKVGKDTNDITDCRFHDTIFIDGDRGVGKTAFMVNIENYYIKYFKMEKKPKYIFLKPVDPTLLENTEKFLGVILGKIVEMVSKRLKNNCIDGDDYYIDNNCDRKYKNENPSKNCIDGYYKALENLSKSLSAVSSLENKQDVGIEEIVSYKSSQKLEQYAHEFFQIVSTMFGVNAIVMLIDDVDMAFDKGFDVLEVVRKYLASPYLIPIVAGDMKLYREIVETKFMDKIAFNKDVSVYNQMKSIFEKGCSDTKEINKNWDNTMLGCNHELLIQNRKELKDKKDLVNHLVEQYLQKIFPNEYHIKLKDIFSILKFNKVQVKLNDNLKVPYTEIKDFEIRHINLGINQIDFTYQVFSNNTRDLVQYLFAKKNIYMRFFCSIKDYPTEGIYKKYIPQIVINKYDKYIFSNLFKNSELYKNSLEITNSIYEYKQGKQKELSKLTENDAKAFDMNKYNIYKALNGDVFNNSKIVPESINNKLRVEYKSYKSTKTKYDDIEKYIVDLFVFSDYYAQHQTKKYFFAGKFIEMIIYSLSISEKLNFEQSEKELIKNKLKVINFKYLLEEDDYNLYSIFYDTNNIDLNKANKNDLELSNIFNKITLDIKEDDILSEIPNKIPFNSIFLYNKRFTDSEPNDEEIDLSFEYRTNELKRNLIIWKNVFCSEDLKLNSISLYEILHKFFNNFNVVKNLDLSDNPLKFMQRTILIFINSIAYFENTDTKVANTNIAVNKQFDYNLILEKTNASLKNIKPMFDENNSLTKALFFHPIISHILYPDKDSKLESLSFVKPMPLNSVKSNNDSKEKKINENKKKELEKIFFKYWDKIGEYKKDLPQKMNPVDICKNYFRDIINAIDNDSKIILSNKRAKYVSTYNYIYKEVLDKDTELKTLMLKYKDTIYNAQK